MFAAILIAIFPSGLRISFRFAVSLGKGFQGLLPCPSYHNSPYFWVIEPMCGFCLRFRISIPTLHRGTGEVMGSGFQQFYEQDSNQSSIYHSVWWCAGPPRITVGLSFVPNPLKVLIHSFPQGTVSLTCGQTPCRKSRSKIGRIHF